jgi:hypothetical protein
MSNYSEEKWCFGDGPVINSESEMTLRVKLNPTVVPAKFTRYRHPSHKHRMFMIISFGHNTCNNNNCRNLVQSNNTLFRCFKCDYDLCGKCFQLGTKEDPIPLAEDDANINDTTVEPIINSFCVDPEY